MVAVTDVSYSFATSLILPLTVCYGIWARAVAQMEAELAVRLRSRRRGDLDCSSTSKRSFSKALRFVATQCGVQIGLAGLECRHVLYGTRFSAWRAMLQ